MQRLDPRTFVFRTALCAGRSIGDAAGTSLECDETFDAGERCDDWCRRVSSRKSASLQKR